MGQVEVLLQLLKKVLKATCLQDLVSLEKSTDLNGRELQSKKNRSLREKKEDWQARLCPKRELQGREAEKRRNDRGIQLGKIIDIGRS